MTYTTQGGTTFTVVDGKVTITRSDQPEVTIPEDDLEEFFADYFAACEEADAAIEDDL